MTKSKRSGKILFDYLRNGRGSTAVAPYSTRARPDAAIAMPLDWSELSLAIARAYFTVTNAFPRLAALEADGEDFWKAAVPLKDGTGGVTRGVGAIFQLARRLGMARLVSW